MTNKTLALALYLSLSVASAAGIQPALFQNGTTTHLGSFGGNWGIAYAINNAGQVVGFSQNASGLYLAFIWQSGTMTSLGTLPGMDESVAVGINASGQVVGYSMLDGNNGHAFFWQSGVMTDLGEGFALGVNNSGQVIGLGGSTPGFLWQSGTTTPLNFYPRSINNLGQILFGAQPSLWDNGVITNLNGVPSGAAAINDSGQIAGSSGVYPWIWQSGVMTTTSNLCGVPWAINLSGEILYQACTWQNGAATNLNQIYGAGAGFHGINDSGQIVGAAP